MKLGSWDLTRWTGAFQQIRRWARLASVTLAAGLVWQVSGLFRGVPMVRAQVPEMAGSFIPPTPVATFSLDRFVSPPNPEVTGTSLVTGASAPRLTLQGVLSGSPPRAYLIDEGTGQTISVREGDQLGLVTIRAIKERTVVLEQEGAIYELRL